MIDPIKQRHLRLADDVSYSASRWTLIQTALRISKSVIREASGSLEIEPYQVPLFSGSIIIARRPTLSRAAIAALRPKAILEHDVTMPSWPITWHTHGLKLAVAFQVWEGLRGRQAQAFAELRRNADYALMTFPFEWELAHATDERHGVTRSVIDAWTPGARVVHEEVCMKPDPARKVLVRLYDLEGQPTP